MNDLQIYFEINLLIERADACHDNFNQQEAKRIVKRSKFLYELVTRLIIEANTTKELSNLASNKLTHDKFQVYTDNLLIIEEYFRSFIDYEPKTKTGYYMFVKDMVTYSPVLNGINVEKQA